VILSTLLLPSSRVLALAIFCSAVLHGASAAADPPAGYHRHDGFYARLGLGPGYLHDSVHFAAHDPSITSTYDGTISGGGVGLEIALGGTIAPGVVVGGGLFHTFAFSPKADVPGIDAQPNTPFGHFLISPLVDVYPDPTAGFHVEGGAGLALSSGAPLNPALASSALPPTSTVKLGFGGFVGVGHEWWLAGDWGAGLLLRASLLRAGETQGNALTQYLGFPAVTTDWDVTHIGWQLSLMGTVTYH
jgi:hypothetical protein